MKFDFEIAQKRLREELELQPHVKEDLFGNAGASRKIMEYVIATINSNVDRAKCLDDFQKILEENNVENVYSTTYDAIVGMFFEILERYNREFRTKREIVINK